MKESSAAFQTFIRNQLKRLEDAEQVSGQVPALKSPSAMTAKAISGAHEALVKFAGYESPISSSGGNLTSDSTTKLSLLGLV